MPDNPELLKAQIKLYYYELMLRGDKNLLREYCQHFGLTTETINGKTIVR